MQMWIHVNIKYLQYMFMSSNKWTVFPVQIKKPWLYQIDLLISFAAGDADEFFDSSRIAQSFGILHILCDDFMQRAADGSYRVVWHGLAGRTCGSGGPSAGGIIVAAATAAW